MVPMWSQSITTISFWVFYLHFSVKKTESWIIKVTHPRLPSWEARTNWPNTQGLVQNGILPKNTSWAPHDSKRVTEGQRGEYPWDQALWKWAGRKQKQEEGGVRFRRRTSFSSSSPTQGDPELGWSACDIALSWARTTTSLGLAWVSDGWSKK